MEVTESIDYKGIGEGLPIRRCTRSSTSSSTISLSDDEQAVSPLGPTQVEHRLDITAKLATNTALVTEPSPVSADLVQWSQLFATINEEPYLNPLDRYYCDPQAHEQFAVGQTPNRRLLSRLDGLAESLGAVVRVQNESSSKASALSDQAFTSISVENSHMTPSLELGDLLRMTDSPEWQNVPDEEQLRQLRSITKLKRRLRKERSPRTAKPTRVRRRSKTSNMSIEITRASQPM